MNDLPIIKQLCQSPTILNSEAIVRPARPFLGNDVHVVARYCNGLYVRRVRVKRDRDSAVRK